MTRDRSGRRRPLPLPAATVAIILLLAGCAEDEPVRTDSEVLLPLSAVVWADESLIEGDIDTCGSVAVVSDLDQDLRVALVDQDRVFVPEVTPPPGSGVVIRNDWITSGGCVPTTRGPVVVVEAQEAYANLYDAAHKIVAGFTPAGDQLWAIEVPGDLAGNYDGRGSMIFESLDDNAWSVVDARTGTTVASGGLADASPVTTLGPTLVDDIAGGLLDLSTGRTFGRTGDSTAQVDDDRILLETSGGVRLVGLPDLDLIWKAQEDIRLTGIWTEAADLSTSTVVAFDTDGTIVGLDLATGRVKWRSDVPRDEVDGLSTQIGSGVVAFRANGRDPLGQVVLDTTTGEELFGADGYLVADQGLLIDVANGVPTPITVDELR